MADLQADYDALRNLVRRLLVSFDRDEQDAVTGFFSSESYDLLAELRARVDG